MKRPFPGNSLLELCHINVVLRISRTACTPHELKDCAIDGFDDALWSTTSPLVWFFWSQVTRSFTVVSSKSLLSLGTVLHTNMSSLTNCPQSYTRNL